MHLRALLTRFVSGPLLSALLAMFLVVAFTAYTSGWTMVYSASCVDAKAKSNDNNSSDNSSSDNGSDNGSDNSSGDNSSGDNGNDNGSNDNGGSDETASTSAISCDAGEAAIGGQPRASDTQRVDIPDDIASFLGMDGVVVIQWTGGGTVEVTHDPVDPATNPGPAGPAGMRQIRAANLRLLPLETPNNLNITLRYTDSDVAGGPEGSIAMYVYDAGLGTWVQVPATLDPVGNSATWTNVNVALFVDRLTRIALFIPA